MAAKIIPAPSGLDDLGSAVAYIAADNPRAAAAFGESVIARTRHRAAFPRLGKFFASSAAGEIRETVPGHYRILYGVSRDELAVTVFRVWPGARGEPELPPI
jgi:plasmid stabilization system protein ParE